MVNGGAFSRKRVSLKSAYMRLQAEVSEYGRDRRTYCGVLMLSAASSPPVAPLTRRSAE